jgi:hypothetical protein
VPLSAFFAATTSKQQKSIEKTVMLPFVTHLYSLFTTQAGASGNFAGSIYLALFLKE